MCHADVIAQTYISASQSGVTPLAYHFKTPLLVSDIPGLRTPILEDKTGIVSEIDPEKISENLQKILFDDTLPNFQDAFQKVRKKYSWKSLAILNGLYG